jgi:hypothetical protein
MYVLVVCDLARTKEITSGAHNIEEINEVRMLKPSCNIVIMILHHNSKIRNMLIQELDISTGLKLP